MEMVNTCTQDNIELVHYPDNQPHVNLRNIHAGDEVGVTVRLTTANDVMHLLQIADALDRLRAKKTMLTIPYLMGARYDRSMQTGDSVDLVVIAKLINSCGFERVRIFDPHSEVALLLIDRSEAVDNKIVVIAYDKSDAVLIVPDAGAVKKVKRYAEWNPNLKDAVYCFKIRELDTGRVSLTVLDPLKCKDRNCVIFDDICDGGATFLAVAEQISPAYLTLGVSHGIFSKGLRQLKEKFNEIITTDSYQFQNPEPGLRSISIYGN